MSEVPKVLIVGAGALGLVAAYTLSSNSSCEVTLVVKFDTDKVRKDGYSFKSKQFGEFSGWKPEKIIQNVEDTDIAYDYILVSLKNLPDGPEPVEDIIAHAVNHSPESTIIMFENGIDIEKPMIQRFPGHVVVSGVSLINCTNINFVVDQRNADHITLGLFHNPTYPDKAKATEKLNKFVNLYRIEGKNTVNVDPNVRLSRWNKLVYNISINTTTALTQLDVTRATWAGFKENLCRPIIKELYSIAKADGYEIPPEIEQQMLNLSNGLYYKPSMMVDIEHGRMMEIETIVGNPLRIAEKLNVKCPHLHTIYWLLKMDQYRIMEDKGMITVDEKTGTAKKNF